MISPSLIRFVITAAIRDRLIIALFLLLIMAISMSIFMGSAAITEQDQFLAVFSAGTIRIINVIGLVLFIVFFIRRSFETRDIEFLLSRPISRIQVIVSFAAGFSIIAAVLGLVSGICVMALSPHLYSDGHLLWTLSLMVENIIMVNAALFFSMILSSAASGAFAVCGFYVLARMMSQILGIIDSNKMSTAMEPLEIVMQTISAVMPRLDLMAQTSWLVYDVDQQIGYGFVITQGVLYAGLLLLAALIDMQRRKF